MKLKTCPKCQITKPVDCFYKTTAGGPKSWCKDCEKSYQKSIYAASPDKVRQRSQNWRVKYADKISKDKKENRAKYYIYELKQKYGISKPDAEALLEENGSACAICEREFNPSIPLLRRNLDHCHKTGMVGSFICSRCNTLLGLLDDETKLLPKLEAYIAKHRKCITT